ncbi:hypothetical protein Rhopal_007400-T1 [Rhodotorula paludigena]|uniref:Ras GEF n=1 Tax=Rhodotorula paludigena TaxID=86838 RepID=A0AAV5GPM1_9BASI|nr:hypothetical protein Rhopal_007400-T1 [Rhodotorula paludigena]
MSTSPLASPALAAAPGPAPSPPQGFTLVRALHSFSPATLAGTANTPQEQQASSCIAFEAGQIIKCLNRDPSGWWDCEVDGKRGWAPSNYLEDLADAGQQVRRRIEQVGASSSSPLSAEATTLLSSIEHNVRLLGNAARAQRKGHYQPSTACVISSIRTVLSATSALTRDSPVLRAHPSLSSYRKRILTSLAALVNQARKASAPSPSPPAPDQAELDEQDADEMLRIAHETLGFVRTFLEQAEERGVEVNLSLGSAAPVAASGMSVEGSSSPSPGNGVAASLRGAKSLGNLRDQRRPTLEALNAPMPGSAFPQHQQQPSTSPSHSPDSSPTAASALASSSTPFDPSTQLILRTPSAIFLHLSTLHDSLLSTIAALIGHVHSHARSSSPASSFAHLIDLTREGIERVRDVLVVVEKVGALVQHDGAAVALDDVGKSDEMKVLAATRERLYEATTALVAAARVATSPRSTRKGSVDSARTTSSAASAGEGAAATRGASRDRKRNEREEDEGERKDLLGAATGVLRAGGDCVGAVKLVVQQLAAADTSKGFELVLPRPKTVEELAELDHHGHQHRMSSPPAPPAALGSPDADDGGSTSGASAKFADASDELDDPAAVAAAVAATGATPRAGADVDARRRNPHTLSMLGRKASSLGCLRERFDQESAAGAMGAMTLEEADEDDVAEPRRESEEVHHEAEERDEEDCGSAGTGETERTAPSPVVSSSSPNKAHPRSVKTSSISLTPAHAQRSASPAPSTSSTADRSTTRPSSMAMHRAQSSESAHSARSHASAQSSSRQTAASIASSSAVTSQTAETSPRSSMQSPASIATAMRKAAPARSSLGSVMEVAPPTPDSPALPSQYAPTTPQMQQSSSSFDAQPPSANATPRGSVSNGSASGGAVWYLQRDYLPSEISFNADGHVSGGTLRCLVERMTLHDTTIDAAFSNTFLLTFRMYTTPLELAQLLWARFDLAPPRHPETGAELTVDEMKQWTAQKLTPIRLRIYNLFKTWVESYWLHDPDVEIVEGLLEWCRGRLKSAMASASTRLADLVNKRVAAAEREGGRDSDDGYGVRHSNASSASLASSLLSPTSMNGSTLSLSVSNTTPASSIRSGFSGGLLRHMQSTDKLKAGKTVTPFSSLSSSTAQDTYSPTSAAAATAPTPVMTKSLTGSLRPALSGRTPLLSSVTEIDTLELARQLTIMESRVYCSIRPDELLGAGNGAGNGGKGVADAMKAPNVRKMSQLSTRLTGWITEAILGETDQKRRSGLLKYFIKLGERLLALSNYNALFAVFTALNSSTISRLRRTWEGLAPKYRAVFDSLRKATDHARNYAEYRQKIRQAVPPCLPFVGLFLTDLIFVFEGNRAERPSPADPSLLLINFDRYHKLARIVGELQRFQSPHHLVEVPELQAYLSQELEGLKRGQDAQSLYRQSLLIEPRQGSGPSSSAASIISSNDGHRHGPRDLFNWRG